MRAAGENGAHLTLIGQDSCSSKLQSSLRFISTLFPFNLIPPLYICFLYFDISFFKNTILNILPITLVRTHLLSLDSSPLNF